MIQKLERIFEELVHAPDAIQNRKTLAEKLNCFQRLASDQFTMYRLYESVQSEAEEVWKSREWFRTRYEDTITVTQASGETAAETSSCLPDVTLQMYRTGKIGFKYIIKYLFAWLKYKVSGKRT